MPIQSITLQILDHTIKNLSDERSWLKGHLALDKSGYHVGSYSPTACRFCLVGALSNSAYRLNNGKIADSGYVIKEVIRLNHPEFGGDMAEFNDHTKTTHSDVIKVLTEARNIVRNHLKDVQ